MKNKLILTLLLSSLAICACSKPNNSNNTQSSSSSKQDNVSSTTSSLKGNSVSSSSSSVKIENSTSTSSEKGQDYTSSSSFSSSISSSSNSSSSSSSSSTLSSSNSSSNSSISSDNNSEIMKGWLTDNIVSTLPKEKAVVRESIAINEENGKYIIAFAPVNDDVNQPYKVYAYDSNNDLVAGFPKIITNGGAISHFSKAGNYTIKIKTPGDYVNYQDSDFAVATKQITESAPTGINEPICDYGDPLITAIHLTSPVGLEVKSNITGIEGHIVAFSEDSVSNASYFKAYAVDSKGNLVSGFPRTIKAGDTIPYFPVNGTYYVYVQAIGDDTNYKNSPLSNGVAVTETMGTGVISPEVIEENPSKSAIALSAPAGFVINTPDDITDKLTAAWADDNNAASYMLYLALADGTILDGYPMLVKNGDMFNKPTEGTYYAYLQAIGDGISYSNSPLSTSIKLDITNDNQTPVEPENPNPEPENPNPEPENPNATVIDLSTSTYSGGDLIELKFAAISGLSSDNIDNLVVVITNQDGTNIVANELYNFNPAGGYWAIQLNGGGHTSLNVNISFTYNGTEYRGTFTYANSSQPSIPDVPDNPNPEVPGDASTLNISVSQVAGDLLIMSYSPTISGLSKNTVTELYESGDLVMSVIDQDGNEILKNPAYNVNDAGYWAALITPGSYSSLTITISLTINGATYSGQYVYNS